MSLPVACTISGIDSVDVLSQILAAANEFQSMTPAEMRALRERQSCQPDQPPDLFRSGIDERQSIVNALSRAFASHRDALGVPLWINLSPFASSLLDLFPRNDLSPQGYNPRLAGIHPTATLAQ